MEQSMYALFAPSDKFFKRFLMGGLCGRKLELWDYYRNYLFHYKDIIKNIFSYTYKNNQEKELTNEIEERLFFFGKCGIVKSNGVLWAVDANPNGLNRYGKPTKFNYTFRNGEAPTTNVEIGKNGVLGYNTFDMYPTALYAEQFAFQLAHTDTSIVSELVNSRMMDVIVTHSNNSAENANKYLNDIYRGKFAYLTDKVEDMEIDRTNKGIARLHDYIDTKDRILKDSYEMFGIKKLAEKRERMITGEVESTQDLLSLNLKEMLDCRVKMCEDIKKVFGVDIEVHSHLDLDKDGKMENEKEFEKGVENNVQKAD